MQNYQKPMADFISFRPDEALMDEEIGGGLSNDQGGGSPYDAREDRDR